MKAFRQAGALIAFVGVLAAWAVSFVYDCLTIQP